MEEFKGTSITNLYCLNDRIITIDDNYKAYFIDPKQLITILNEFDFKTNLIGKKKWLAIDINNYKIEKLEEQKINNN